MRIVNQKLKHKKKHRCITDLDFSLGENKKQMVISGIQIALKYLANIKISIHEVSLIN